MDQSMFMQVANAAARKLMEKTLGLLTPMLEYNAPADLSGYLKDAFTAKIVPVLPKLCYIKNAKEGDGDVVCVVFYVVCAMHVLRLPWLRWLTVHSVAYVPCNMV